ncbi:MAG: endonuclease/exonuclease/phosphatase [Chitinophagaceae bacterium]
MAVHLRSFAKRLFIFFNVLAAIFFLLSCLAPYLNPQRWWIISLLGLGFGILFILLVVFFFFWLIAKPKFIFISFVALAIGWKSISVFFAFHNPATFSYQKPKNVLRVVQWNVARFVEWRRNNNKGSQARLKMMDLIKEQNADVLCLQEFFHSTDSIYYPNLDYIRKNLNYPYYYFSWDEDGYKQWVGQVIFSRYPLVDTGMIRYQKPSMPEALIHADIVFNNDTIRFYTTHLQSVRFKPKDFERLDKIKKAEDSFINNSKNIFIKLKRGFQNRSLQATRAREILNQSHHSFIFTGDFNDVPNSYAYFTIKDNQLQDAFLQKGFGIGRTFTGISPTLRIDYIFTTKDFTILQFNRAVKNLSDHYMLVADVQLKK